MKSAPWMPFYFGDYAAKTVGFTLAQHGAYFLCIMSYWNKGGALTDAELCRIAGPEVDAIKPFFDKQGNMWVQSRVEQELTKMRDMCAKNHARAIAGGKARHASSKLEASLELAQSQSQSQSQNVSKGAAAPASKPLTDRQRLAGAMRGRGMTQYIPRALFTLKHQNPDPVAVLAAYMSSMTAADPPAYACSILKGGGATDAMVAEAKRLIYPAVDCGLDAELAKIGRVRRG